MIKKAWRFWCNDSFWLLAPYKIRDSGTELALAKGEKGSKGLLISYTSGGITTGDSYLWFMNDEGLPIAVKMWVKVIPIGGFYTDWKSWITAYNGAKNATMRKLSIANFKFNNVSIKTGADLKSIGHDSNPILIES